MEEHFLCPIHIFLVKIRTDTKLLPGNNSVCGTSATPGISHYRTVKYIITKNITFKMSNVPRIISRFAGSPFEYPVPSAPAYLEEKVLKNIFPL